MAEFLAAPQRNAFDNPPVKELPLWLVQGFALYWLVLKVVALFAGGAHPDEAYYWLWGQHFQLSYFDHAPFHAWLQGLVSLVLGWSVFSMRALTFVTTGITLWIIYVWTRRLAPDRWRYLFWLSVALYFSSPMMELYTTMALHDRVMVALAMVSMHCFAWFFVARIDDGRDRTWLLYLAAVALGLATLTKYNAMLVGVGVAIAILIRADLRPLLRNPHLWLAAIISVGIQAPVLIWNLQNGFPSFQFHVGIRANAFDLTHLRAETVQAFILETLLLLSPFAVWPMLRFAFTRAGTGFGGVLHSLGKWVMIASTLAILWLSLTRYVLFYWNILAYAAFFAVSGWFFRSRLLILLQLAYGLIINTALIVHFTIYPVLGAVLPQPRSDFMFGWDQVVVAVKTAERDQGADFAASVSWGSAARLAFAMQRADLPAISPTLDAFDYWFTPADFVGKDAIVLIDPDDVDQLPIVAERFDSFELLQRVDVTVFGNPIYHYDLYVGRNFHPEVSEAISG